MNCRETQPIWSGQSTRSKGDGRPIIDITVDDIRKGIATDENGYRNEVVLFLRKNKKDR